MCVYLLSKNTQSSRKKTYLTEAKVLLKLSGG